MSRSQDLKQHLFTRKFYLGNLFSNKLLASFLVNIERIPGGQASLLLNLFVCSVFYSIVAPRIILPNSVYTLTTIAADWPQFMTFNKNTQKLVKLMRP